MINIGTLNISELYIGTEPVDEVYIGTLKVYPDGGPEPTDKHYIYYTSADGNVVDTVSSGWGANLLSNTYADKGVLTFDGEPTAIPANAFSATNIASIDLPESVTSVGMRAFQNCNSLTECDLSNVTDLGAEIFASATNLRKCKLNENLTELPAGMFYQTDVRRVGPDWGDIGTEGFDINFDVKVPLGLKKLNGNVFRGSNIEECYIFSLEEMLNSPFQDCVSLRQCELGGQDDVTGAVSATMTLTGQNQFSGCTSMEFLRFGSGLNTPEYNNSFVGCTGTLEVDGSVCFSATSSNKVFANSKFTSFIVSGAGSIGSYIWDGNTSLKSLVVYGNGIVPKSFAFRNAKALEKVTMNEWLGTTYHNAIFNGCSSLKKVSMLSLKECYNGWFYDCNSLTEVVMPNLENATSELFGYCAKLNYVYLPKIKKFDSGVFRYKDNITYNFGNEMTTLPVYQNSYNVLPTNTYFVVPDALYDAFNTDVNWKRHTGFFIRYSEYHPESITLNNAYYDTGVVPNEHTYVECVVGDVKSSNHFFGCWASDYNVGAFAVGNDETNLYVGLGNSGGGNYGWMVTNENERNTISLSAFSGCIVNGERVREGYSGQFSTVYPLYIGAQNRIGYPFLFTDCPFKLYSFHITTSTGENKTYIPCRDGSLINQLTGEKLTQVYVYQGSGGSQEDNW